MKLCISISRLQIHRDIYRQHNGVYFNMLLVRTGPSRLVVATEMRSKSYRLNYG
jgi:hypothetical protein